MKIPKLRFRHLFIGVGSTVVVSALFLSDPAKGLSTWMLLLGLVTPIVAVAFAHWGRKALFDYLDLQTIARRAHESPTGAGLVFVGVCLVIYGLLALFGRAAHAQVPQRAYALLPTLGAEIDAHWPAVPLREYLPGLVEHESCITLQHSRCWSPSSRLKTAREEGAGLGQLTRAWSADGRLRFDALAELRAQHPALQPLDWANVYARPDLQLRALVLKVRGDYTTLRDVPEPLQRLAMADAAYNGGIGGVQRERRACAISGRCDPARWWRQVEAHCLKSQAPLYAGRSACDINRHHVRDVFEQRAPKYRGLVPINLGTIG